MADHQYQYREGQLPNVDLLAAKGHEARGIQVKITDAEKGSHKHCLFMGRGEPWLTSKVSFFNRKAGPLFASVVVLVSAKRKQSQFVVLPVAVAEMIARRCVDHWYAIPKRDGGTRAAGYALELAAEAVRHAFDASPPHLIIRIAQTLSLQCQLAVLSELR